MRIRLLIPVLSSATLALFAFSANPARAGSFFGPSCYGADYTYQYPNRSHNVFGCGPGTHCQAWHGFFHRRARRNQNVPNDGMPTNAMPTNGIPGDGMPMTGMPMNGMPAQMMQTPIMQPPSITAPIHTTSTAPAPVPVMPAVQSRIIPVPASAEPPLVDQSSKPPF